MGCSVSSELIANPTSAINEHAIDGNSSANSVACDILDSAKLLQEEIHTPGEDFLAPLPEQTYLAPNLNSSGTLTTGLPDLEVPASKPKLDPLAITVEVKAGKKFFGCMCHQSSTYPNCDGSHVRFNSTNKTTFGPKIFSAPKDTTPTTLFIFCDCGQDSNCKHSSFSQCTLSDSSRDTIIAKATAFAQPHIVLLNSTIHLTEQSNRERPDSIKPESLYPSSSTIHLALFKETTSLLVPADTYSDTVLPSIPVTVELHNLSTANESTPSIPIFSHDMCVNDAAIFHVASSVMESGDIADLSRQIDIIKREFKVTYHELMPDNLKLDFALIAAMPLYGVGGWEGAIRWSFSTPEMVTAVASVVAEIRTDPLQVTYTWADLCVRCQFCD